MAKNKKPVRYCGPHDKVLIAATGLTVARGETVELAGRLADQLLEQPDTWQLAATTPSVAASAGVDDPQED